jgi:hypothetical protein
MKKFYFREYDWLLLRGIFHLELETFFCGNILIIRLSSHYRHIKRISKADHEERTPSAEHDP